MSISAKTVMDLRAKTGAGMMDCKKALLETNGEIETAINYLREKGISKAAKKAGRVAAEGLVFAAVTSNNKVGAILEFNSETDFVAKNDDFVNYGNKLVELILNSDVNTVEELNNVNIDGKTVAETTAELIATIGENMNIRRFSRITSEGFVSTYIHMGGKIGVILKLEGEANEENLNKAKDIAMHAAAMDPEYLDKSEVTEEDLEKEKAILRAQLLEEGKPEKIIDNILIGKMRKFFEEHCLLQQKFVKDDKISVEEYAGDIKVFGFNRFKLGEGIEKEETDFAAEVAAQIKSH